jgi:SH3-like domain-containing protein
VPAQDAQPQQPVEEVAVVLPAATPEPFSLAIDPVAAAADVTVNCTIKATKVDARTGPDVRFTFAGHHVAGEPCIITARYYDWFYVTFPSNNSKGWLYLEWLNISDPASLASIPQIVVNTDWVWMRNCKKYCR